MSRSAAAAPPAALTEALQGWRAWQVVARRDGVALRSLWVNVAWPACRPLQSGCSLHGARIVAWHICGIHAFSDRDELQEYVGRRPEQALPRLHGDERALGIAVGRVSGWGRAICHERGWRSQFAYPYALYLLSGDKGVARALADRYAVETAPFAPAG